MNKSQKNLERNLGLEVSAAYGIIEIGLPFINHSGNPEFRAVCRENSPWI